MRSERGFTLIEVLVALVVVTLVLAGTAVSVDMAARTAFSERERMFAHWVAENVIVRYRMETPWPGVGEDDGEEPMAEREWRWRATVGETEVDGLRRLEVEVWRPGSEGPGEAAPLIRRVAFLGDHPPVVGTDPWALPGVEDPDDEDTP